MGFKIWRRDNQNWDLAFDIIFTSKESAENRIAELNAIWHDPIKFGELEFLAYPEEIKIAKNGSILDKNLPTYRKKNNGRKKHNKIPKNPNIKFSKRKSRD
jgi:hypothetical protein